MIQKILLFNFSLQEVDGRVYRVGNMLIKVPKKVIEKFFEWRKEPFNTNERIDKKFVGVLYKVCMEAKNANALDGNQYKVDVKEFIKALFGVRVGNDFGRRNNFEAFFNEF